jgi:hypothetical protein
MEETIMKSKLAKIVLVCFLLMLCLSIIGLIITPFFYHPTYSIGSYKLSEKPNSYFVLNNPDKYFLESLSKNYSSRFLSLEETQIDELTSRYGSNNLEYNGAYYRVYVSVGDNFPPVWLIPMLFAGMSLSITAIIILSILTVRQSNKRDTSREKVDSALCPEEATCW